MKSTDKPVAKEIIQLLLSSAKIQTMTEIYNRVRPGEDGRIRTDLSPVGTSTGRLASKETFLETSTNLQNIPKKTAKLDRLFDVRTVLVPDEGTVLLEADLSQAEARATAGFANDLETLATFDSGQDIHKITASAIFNLPVEKINDGQRHLGKMARHALNYGMGWKLFQARINKDADLTGVAISARMARDIVEAYHRANPALLRWWRKVEHEVKSKGYLTNAYGRKHIFLDRSDSARNAWIAYQPQSTIADHLNRRLIDVYASMDPEELQVVLQVHDSVVALTQKKGWHNVAKKLKSLMERSVSINGITVPLPADVAASTKSWADMREVIC